MAEDQSSKPSRADKFRRLLDFGKKGIPVLSGLVAPEFVPIVQGIMSRLATSENHIEHSVEELEHRVADQLRQNVAVQDQHHEELRRSLAAQAEATARLQSDIGSLRALIERAESDKSDLQESFTRLERRLTTLGIGVVAAVVLAGVSLAFVLLKR